MANTHHYFFVLLPSQLSRTMARSSLDGTMTHGRILAERSSMVIMSRRSSTLHYKDILQLPSCSSSTSLHRSTASLRKRTANERALLTRSTVLNSPHTNTGALQLEEAAAATATASSTMHVPRPTPQALRTLFVASAIPMVGFGFMDNLVMIQAGQYIDSTLGVTLGLATMTAAAMGQVFSDVAGVMFGGTLERFLTRLSLIQAPALTTAQRQLPLCRNVAMAGAVLGVICGCALGASTLLFLDLEARERIHHATQLQDILTDMISDHHNADAAAATAAAANGDDDEMVTASATLPCQTCTIHLAAGHDKFTVDNTTAVSGKTRLAVMDDAAPNSVVQQCGQTKQVVVQGRLLYAPVVLSNGQLLAVLEFQGDQPFTQHHVLTVQVMARHLAIVLKHLVD